MADDRERAQHLFDTQIDNEEFWKDCDDILILDHGQHARRWLGMLEDPDPEDLIFAYNRIIREQAFFRGYMLGKMDKILESNE